MKLKKAMCFCLASLLSLLLAGCGAEKGGAFQPLEKPGIAPYSLSESEELLLRSLGLNGSAQFVKFRSPAEAKSLNVDVYRLHDGAWESVGGGGISLDTDKEDDGTINGVFTMRLLPDHAIEFHICTGEDLGSSSAYTSDELPLEEEMTGSSQCFFQNDGKETPQEIQLGREIPVALMAYDSGTSMQSFTLEDYFNPAALANLDLVQAVVLTFE